MKTRHVSMPLKWYMVGLACLVLLLVLWIRFSNMGSANNEKFVMAAEVFKNTFFAILGSYLVALLVDVGNTSKENKLELESFELLKPSLALVYDIVSSASFIYENCFDVADYGTITLRHYYNHEFWYKTGNVNQLFTLATLASFTSKYKKIVSRMKLSSYYLMLNKDVKGILEKAFLEGFPCLHYISEDRIPFTKVRGMKSDIKNPR